MATHILWQKDYQTKDACHSKYAQDNKLSNPLNGFALVELTLWLSMLVLIFAFSIKMHRHIEDANIHLLKQSKQQWQKLERKYAKEK